MNPNIRIETLVPDFRGRMDTALELLKDNPPDVFNHNLETAPRLYRKVRPVRTTSGHLICFASLKNNTRMSQPSLV